MENPSVATSKLLDLGQLLTGKLPPISTSYAADSARVNSREGSPTEQLKLNKHSSGKISTGKNVFNETFSALPPAAKAIVRGNRKISQLVESLHKANACFEEVIGTVRCYRNTLGTTLDKVFWSYNRIFGLLLEETLKTLGLKEEEVKTMGDQNLEQIEKERNKRKEYVVKIKLQQTTISALKSQLRAAQIQEDMMSKELTHLREILKYEFRSEETPADAEELMDDHGVKHEAGPKHIETVKQIIEDGTLKTQLDELQAVMSEIELEHSNKQELLSNMNGVLKSMVKSSSTREYGTQVGDGELFWNVSPGTVKNPVYKPDSVMSNLLQYRGGNVEIQPRAADQDKWTLTSGIMRFLANTPSYKGRVWPYPYFKTTLMDLLNDRLAYNTELVGSLQPNVPLDEFICLFFLKRSELRRLAELKVTEFLASLKYYSQTWERVKVFCKVVGFMGDPCDNDDYLWSDYNTQLYFLYVIRLIQSGPEYYWEDTNGQVWMKHEREEQLSKDLLSFSKDYRKLRQKIRSFTSRINDLNGQQGDFIEVDKLLSFYMTEYVSQRNSNQKKLTKSFLKRNQLQQGHFSFEEFSTIFKLAKVDDNKLSFPGELAMMRAFLFALSVGHNSFEINNMNFLSACVVYGLDSPYPLVQTSYDYLISQQLISGTGVDSARQGIDTRNVRTSSKEDVNDRKTENKSPAAKGRKGFASSSKNDLDDPTSDDVRSRIAALFAQQYSIVRELLNHTQRFNDLSQTVIVPFELADAFQRLLFAVNSASEFLTYPISI